MLLSTTGFSHHLALPEHHPSSKPSQTLQQTQDEDSGQKSSDWSNQHPQQGCDLACANTNEKNNSMTTTNSPQIKSDDEVTATHAAQTQRVTGSAVEKFGNIKSDELRESHVKVIIPLTEKDSRKLFVGRLPSNVTDKEFLELFQRIGAVLSCIVMFDRETHRSRGFGFVTFADPAVALSLVAEGFDDQDVAFGHVIMRGKKCEIRPAIPKAPDSINGIEGYILHSSNQYPQRGSREGCGGGGGRGHPYRNKHYNSNNYEKQKQFHYIKEHVGSSQVGTFVPDFAYMSMGPPHGAPPPMYNDPWNLSSYTVAGGSTEGSAGGAIAYPPSGPAAYTSGYCSYAVPVSGMYYYPLMTAPGAETAGADDTQSYMPSTTTHTTPVTAAHDPLNAAEYPSEGCCVTAASIQPTPSMSSISPNRMEPMASNTHPHYPNQAKTGVPSNQKQSHGSTGKIRGLSLKVLLPFTSKKQEFIIKEYK